MKLKAFSIRDAKAEIFHAPFYKGAFGEAEREFKMMVDDEKSKLSRFPEDFDLYHVGEYDDQTGVFASLDTPKHMMKAVTLVAAKSV